jgi:hypothetical protein
MKIAFVTIATNKYIQYAENLLESMNKYAFPNTQDEVDLIVFTNIPELFKNRFGRVNPIGVHITHVPFPLISLLRYHYYSNCEVLQNYDYVYHIDCDMIMKDVVGQEILGHRVCVSHPAMSAFDNNLKFPYDRNMEANSGVDIGEGQHYYQNCFQGGEGKEFISMCKYLRDQAEEDLRKNYIALWHDESYMNKYMVSNPPTVVLPPTYAQPESWPSFGPTKILHIDKNHLQVRKSQ